MSNLLFLIINLLIYCFNNQKPLNHNYLNYKKYNNNIIEQNRNIYKTKLNIFKNIRIHVDLSYLKSEVMDYILNIYSFSLNKAKRTLQKLIKVEKETSPIDINNLISNTDKYFKNKNLDPNLFNGIKTDLIILVREGEPNELNGCFEKSSILKRNKKNRPIVGLILIDKTLITKIDNNDKYKKEFYSYYFLHQFTHILGFIKNDIIMNGIFIGDLIVHRIPNTPIVKKFISSHTLLSKAKKYFNCEKINGIEIEENGCDEEYIHWESRILLGEYMTSQIYVQEQVISEFTLSLFKDFRYYDVNYYTGGLMKFGKNAKCNFFNTDCNKLLIDGSTENTQRYSTFPNEFCSSITKSTCTSGRLSRGICENSLLSNDMLGSKYFRNSWENYGNQYADYCPISLSEKEAKAHYKKYSYIGNCNLGSKNEFGHYAFYYWQKEKKIYNYSIFSTNYGESFSDISFCAFSSVIHKDENNIKKQIYKGFIRPTCYEMYCSTKSLTIKINNQYIVCPKTGGYIKIGGNYTGYLLCPHYNLICSQTVPCNNMFDCVEKESKEREDLKYDYTPIDFSIQIILPDTRKDYKSAYEESNNGKCPIGCSECNEYSQCFKCNPNLSYYIGNRENDKNPIICSKDVPRDAYYKIKRSNNNYYFKCIEHCKKCSSANICDACEPEYKLINHICEERIEGCIDYNESYYLEKSPDNGFEKGYIDCIKCDDTRNYYCLGDNKQRCEIILDISSYYIKDNNCIENCLEKYEYCLSCDKNKCNECLPSHYLNHENKCLRKILHCIEHDLNSNLSECIKCEDNYTCLNNDKKICNEISNKDLYYYIDNENICMEKCSNRFAFCKSCEKDICKNCEDQYFVYNNVQCLRKLEHCVDNYYDGTNKYCKKCEDHYYCVNLKKDECKYIEEKQIKYYYEMNSGEYHCIDKCRNLFPNCIKCTKEKCEKCKPNFIMSKDYKKCNINPNIKQVDICSIKFHKINTDIKDIDLKDFADNYYKNFPSFNTVDHYINKDYSIIVFIHSKCTEDLLIKGYFKIDFKEEQQSLVKEFQINEKLIYNIFVTYKLKSHFNYFDIDLNYIDKSIKNNYSKNKYYIITNKYIRNIKKTLGSVIANLVEFEYINIFEKDSIIYNNYCQNVTLLGVDMPLKQRLLLLYTHIYSEQIACLGENCIIEDLNFEESTCTCKCKIGNKFEELFNETKFKHYEGPIIESYNFMDSIRIIKCTMNGFNSKNIKSNVGFFLVIIGIILQIILYIYYLLYSESKINLSKIINNPPRKTIKKKMIFSKFDKMKNIENEFEGEISIQPKYDVDEKLLENERIQNINNIRNISIAINVGDENLKDKKNKLSKKSKRNVLFFFIIKKKQIFKIIKKNQILK